MKKSWCIAVTEYHLMKKVHGALVMTKLEMLQVLVLTLVYHLLLIIAKLTFLGLGEGDTLSN